MLSYLTGGGLKDKMQFLDSVGTIIGSFNIFGMGFALIWIVISVFVARIITEKNDEWLMGIITFLLMGLFVFFADKPEKIVLLVIAILLIILGIFNKIGGHKD